MPSSSSCEVERLCRKHVDSQGHPSCQPGNCQENTHHTRLCLSGSYWDRVNPPAWKSQLTTPFTYSSTLHLGHEAENFVPQGTSLYGELLVVPDTHRDARDKGQKWSDLQFPSPSPSERVFSQKLKHIRIDVLGLLTIFIQPWSNPLRMLIDSFPPPCV